MASLSIVPNLHAKSIDVTENKDCKMNGIKRDGFFGGSVRFLLVVSLTGWCELAWSEFALEGPNVIEYKHMIVLADTKQFIREGVRLSDGGCKFIGNATLQKGESKTELELAYDPDTCRSLVEIGTLISDEFVHSPDQIETEAKVISKTPGSDVVVTEMLGSDEVQAASAASKAILHSWYEDPVGIDLNNVENSVEWHPDGSCAWPSGEWAIVTVSLSWFPYSGWYKVSDSHVATFSCGGVSIETTAHFRNDVFCVLSDDTFADYEPNKVTGLPNGNADFY